MLAAAVAVSSAALAPVVAQQSGTAAKPAAVGGIARTPDGHPDLQGTYDLGTLTPLERPANSPLVLTDEQAAALEKRAAQQNEKGYAPIAGDRAAPPAGGDGSPGPYGNVGGYNNFWLDPGSHYTVVD